MKQEIENTIQKLGNLLKSEVSSNCVAITITLTFQGYTIALEQYSPEYLAESGVSMRNIKGLYIS